MTLATRIYPQDASRALTVVQRRDESVNDNDLASRQLLGKIGDTVPLVFCERVSGVGGAWVSPVLLQLGYAKPNISLMYLVSQGRLGSIATGDVYYGAANYTTVAGGQICSNYEAVPPCLDITAGGGGSVNWDQATSYPGPGLPGNDSGVAAFTTKTTYATEIRLSISGECVYSKSGTFVNEAAGRLWNGYQWFGGLYDKIVSWPNYIPQLDRYISEELKKCRSAGVPMSVVSTDSGAKPSEASTYYRLNTSDIFARSYSVTVYSQVRNTYTVKNQTTGAVAKTGDFWLGNGTSTVTITGLPPNKYTVEIGQKYAERNSGNLNSYNPEEVRLYWSTGASDNAKASVATNTWKAWQFQNHIPGLNGQTIRNVSGDGASGRESFKIDEVIEVLSVSIGGQPGAGVTASLFQNLTLLGAKGGIDVIRPVLGVDYFLQIHAFIRQGAQVKKLLNGDAVASSNLFPDLVRYLMELAGMLNTAQIDLDALRLSALFTAKYGLWFNGVLNVSVNFREWLGRVSPYFLCYPRQIDGKYGVYPALPVGTDGTLDVGQINPVMTFTVDDITAGSYKRTYVEASLRKPFCAVMVYRDQPESGIGTLKTTEVRYTGQALSGPFEQHDLSEFCVSRDHAVMAARFVLATRRWVTHTVAFGTGPQAAQLAPGMIIAVDLTQVTSVGRGAVERILYQVDSLQEDPDGQISVSAVHFPLDSGGRSQIALDLTSGATIAN